MHVFLCTFFCSNNNHINFISVMKQLLTCWQYEYPHVAGTVSIDHIIMYLHTGMMVGSAGVHTFSRHKISSLYLVQY